MDKLIYFAEDEANIRIAVAAFLEKEGYQVKTFENGDLLFDEFLATVPDLVILDVMMPGSDGFIICEQIRRTSNVPIIILTARGSDEDYITGISLGSDDYLTKPFSPIKLVMRVKALFRRLEMAEPLTSKELKIAEIVEYDDITINVDNMQSFCQGVKLKLTITELNFLLYLLKNQDKAVARDELLSAVWDYEREVETRVTDDTVKRLRKKLMAAGSDVQIETVWGYGFRIGVKGE